MYEKNFNKKNESLLTELSCFNMFVSEKKDLGILNHWKRCHFAKITLFTYQGDKWRHQSPHLPQST